jgi:hypothetical protein
MHSHALPRLLFVGFLFAFIAAGAVHYRAGAEQIVVQDWTVMQSQENVPVQACGGSAITTSYTTTRDYRRFNDPNGKMLFERQQVEFTGAIGNAVTGKSYAYDGHFTKNTDYDQRSTEIANLKLRFEVGTPGMFTYSLDQVEFNLADDPAAIVKAIVPQALHMDLCYLLGGPTESKVWIPSADFWTNGITENVAPGETQNVHTENSALEQSDLISRLPKPAVIKNENSGQEQTPEASDHMTNWSELDPCDTTPSGQPC